MLYYSYVGQELVRIAAVRGEVGAVLDALTR